MPENIRAELAKITKQPQRQDGTNDQLRDLHEFAVRLGLQDAADYIKQKPLATLELPANLKTELDKITEQTPSQDRTNDQLRSLHGFATRLGLYDAADIVKTGMNRKPAP